MIHPCVGQTDGWAIAYRALSIYAVARQWTKYKQDANLRNSYCSYKNLHQVNTVVSQYLNTYRTFTSNTT